jgi:hypothetical protein
MSEETTNTQDEFDLKSAADLTFTICYLWKKGMPDEYIHPNFSPEGDHCNIYRSQAHQIKVIRTNIPDMILSDEEKKQLAD